MTTDTPKNGLHTGRYEDGQKKYAINYKNGKPDGLSTWWDEDGQKVLERYYEAGDI
jgi:antitoxin component YwqK of YwqJK toxin-antitoxin module